MSNRRRVKTRARPVRSPASATNRRQGLKLAAAVGIPLLVAVTLIAVAAPGDSGDDRAAPTTTTTARPASPEARAWQTRVDDALRPFADRLPPLIQAASEWNEKKTDGQALRDQVTLYLPEAVKARQALTAIPPLDEAPAARDLYRHSIGMYVEIGRVYQAATDPAAEPLRTQLDLAARRLRSLADKIYDQAAVMVDPRSQAVGGDGSVELRLGPEVPDWDAEALAAGPPLAEPPPPPPPTPTEREGTRPQESEKKWLSRVRKADIPSSAELAGAVKAGDPERLGELAETYLAAVIALRAAPDPEEGRGRAAVAALTFLVDAEAARLAQAAAVLPPGPAQDRLATVARRLTLIGEDLLEEELRGPPSGFDRALLDDGP